MILALAAIYIILSLFIGGDRTSKALITLSVNLILLFLTVGAVFIGASPVVAALLSCLLITLNTLFYQNEVNPKTKAAFVSVIIIIALMLPLIYWLTTASAIYGFPVGQYTIRKSNGYEEAIGINMVCIQILVILIILIGAVIDNALSVTSSMYELYQTNPAISRRELFASGMNIGKNILSSTVNTLFFIFMGEYFTLFILFMRYFTFQQMINSKEFAQQVITITVSGFGSILIIPAAALISCLFYLKEKKKSRHKKPALFQRKKERLS
mgnify:CR=1 FL=1